MENHFLFALLLIALVAFGTAVAESSSEEVSSNSESEVDSSEFDDEYDDEYDDDEYDATVVRQLGRAARDAASLGAKETWERSRRTDLNTVGAHGFDTSKHQGVLPDLSGIKLKKHGSFAIFQISFFGKLVEPAIINAKKCQELGIRVDGFYIIPKFPHGVWKGYGCSDAVMEKTATDQIKEVVNYLKQNDLLKGKILWLDVEPDKRQWFKTASGKYRRRENFKYYKYLMNALDTYHPGGAGVYTGRQFWAPIMGYGELGIWENNAQYPLWYPKYDKKCVDNTKSFGGFTNVVMKQYAGNVWERFGRKRTYIDKNCVFKSF